MILNGLETTRRTRLDVIPGKLSTANRITRTLSMCLSHVATKESSTILVTSSAGNSTFNQTSLQLFRARWKL